MFCRPLVAIIFLLAASGGSAAASEPASDVVAATANPQILQKVISWRRKIHAHPELSNQETNTSTLIEAEMRALGLEVHTGIAGHGVIAVLRGKTPGKILVLRADMDALPVAEQTGLPFASKVTADWAGNKVPVMHACGHDAHVAMLMGAATVLAPMKDRISGTIVFLFQPAEEGDPLAEVSGASLVVKEGLLASLKPDAIVGLHVVPGPVGELSFRTGPFMAAADAWEIEVDGTQTHGAMPWMGADASSVAADIVTTFNQIVSRRLNVAHSPTVLSVGQISLGNRPNIIPGKFQMAGTLRTFDPVVRDEVHKLIQVSLDAIGLKYSVKISFRDTSSVAVTSNDSDLAHSLEGSLRRASNNRVMTSADYVMASEDFSAYASLAPTFFYHLGSGMEAPNHSPRFDIDERAMEIGVRAHVLSALDFLAADVR